MFEYQVICENHETVLCLCTWHSVVFETSLQLWWEFLREGLESTLGRYCAQLGLYEPPNFVPDLSVAIDFTNLILNLTNSCNFLCPYCFRENVAPQSMKAVVFEKAVDLIPRFFNNQKCNISFFGGEPLLLFKRIKRMTEYVKRKLEGRPITFSITTNGSLITPEVADYLADNDFEVLVSLDSFQEVNSRTRIPRDRDPKEVYAKIIEGVRDLLARQVNVACNIVITGANVDTLADFILFLREIGLHKISMSLVSDNKFILMPSIYNQLLAQEEQIIDLLLTEASIKVDPISAIMDLLRSHKLYLYRCGYGRRRVNIQPNGDITPCQRVFIPIGNVTDGINLEQVREIALDSVDKRPTCEHCKYRYLCGGNCYHESLVYENNIRNPYHPYCEHYAKLVGIVCKKMMQQCDPLVSLEGFKVL